MSARQLPTPSMQQRGPAPQCDLDFILLLVSRGGCRVAGVGRVCRVGTADPLLHDQAVARVVLCLQLPQPYCTVLYCMQAAQ